MNNTTKKSLCAILTTLMCVSVIMGTGCAATYESAQDYAGYNSSPMTSTEYEYFGGTAIYSEPDWNTEEYTDFDENGFKSVVVNPLSTFSADVDTASYSVIRRMINDGQVPPPDAVRIEEMLNYFKFDYPEPTEDQPFSVSIEMSDCPWNTDTSLLLIGLKAQEVDVSKMPDNNLVFLIDVSGSMDDSDKLPLVKQAFSLLVEQLDERDRISIVTYAGYNQVVLEGATGDDSQIILDAINNLTAGGGTAGADGINTAYELAEANFIEGANNRIILATDGDMNIGLSSTSQLKRLVEKKRETGVYLSVLGFGQGNIKDDTMEALADNGNGSYHYIDTVGEARRVLIEEMGGTLLTVAQDVKLQVEFNPYKVKGYRLIGYEDRLLADEDFDNDEKDAGDIGAGHRVTALYEIVKVDSAMEIEGPELTYQQSESTGSSDYLTLSLRYKEPGESESLLLNYPVDDAAERQELSDNLRLASAIAETGMLLRQSDYAGTSTFDSALELLKGLKDLTEDDYKLEFYTMVSRLKDIASDTDE